MVQRKAEQAQQAKQVQAELTESKSEAAHLQQQLTSTAAELKLTLEHRSQADELQVQLCQAQADALQLRSALQLAHARATEVEQTTAAHVCAQRSQQQLQVHTTLQMSHVLWRYLHVDIRILSGMLQA